jgi:phospholipase/carboxylesterase
MHQKNIIYTGKNLDEAQKALVMVHGRGGSAEDILSLVPYLGVEDFAVLAPRATGNSWYPYSFLVHPSQNEPWLSSALDLLKEIVLDIEDHGITKNHIYFTGFSQGACLSLEFVGRNATRYGGLVAFSGGLIGDNVVAENYNGDFDQMPVFIGSSDPDPHIPVERVTSSAEILKKMNAAVNVKIYQGMGHTISKEEIDEAKMLVFERGSS